MLSKSTREHLLRRLCGREWSSLRKEDVAQKGTSGEDCLCSRWHWIEQCCVAELLRRRSVAISKHDSWGVACVSLNSPKNSQHDHEIPTRSHLSSTCDYTTRSGLHPPHLLTSLTLTDVKPTWPFVRAHFLFRLYVNHESFFSFSFLLASVEGEDSFLHFFFSLVANAHTTAAHHEVCFVSPPPPLVGCFLQRLCSPLC